MRTFTVALAALAASTGFATASPVALESRAVPSGVLGVDVSGHNSPNWDTIKSQGGKWAYIKATEGTSFKSDKFSAQYTGSYNAGLMRGSYHFANPKDSSGSAQANYFVKNGGGWSKDGKTLPGVLDIEYNPYSGNSCYDLSQSGMVSWIKDFTSTYKSLTGRDAVIYTTTDWWTTCTGNSESFKDSNPLWIARYSSSVGTLPGGWPAYTFNAVGPFGQLDSNVFNGSQDRLLALANGA